MTKNRDRSSENVKMLVDQALGSAGSRRLEMRMYVCSRQCQERDCCAQTWVITT